MWVNLQAVSGGLIVCVLATLAICRYAPQRTLSSKTYLGSNTNGTIELGSRQAPKCCGRGFRGNIGMCSLGDPRGVCCGTEVALWCGSGSTCYLNSFGHPYCCASGWVGCGNVCLKSSVRAVGTCNEVAPQGFNFDGTFVWISAQWDATNRRYIFDGTPNIRFTDPPIQIGTCDFTLTATITPRVTGRISFGSIFAETSTAVLYYRFNSTVNLGFSVAFFDTQRASNGNGWETHTVEAGYQNVVLFSLAQPSRGGFPTMLHSVLLNITGTWQAMMPVRYTFIRRGVNLFIFSNGVHLTNFIDSVTPIEPLDIDTGLTAPFEISPHFPGAPFDTNIGDLDGFVSNMSIVTAANFP